MRRSLFLLLALCAVLPAVAQQPLGRHSPQWETRYSSTDRASMVVIGDVNDVLQGRVKHTGFQQVELDNLLFAAGAGTVGKPDAIGEMLTVLGHVYIKSVTNPHRVESTTDRFSTPFCFALPKDAKPREVVYVRAVRGVAMETIHEKLAERYGRTFALAGLVNFRSVSSTALKRGPFYGEPISSAENRDRYFHPVQTLDMRTGIMFGVVVNTEKPEPEGETGALEKSMVYVNYADKNRSALQSHSHVLLLADNPVIPRAITPPTVLASLVHYKPTEIRHLLTQSSVTEALLLVYDIRRLTGR